MLRMFPTPFGHETSLALPQTRFASGCPYVTDPVHASTNLKPNINLTRKTTWHIRCQKELNIKVPKRGCFHNAKGCKPYTQWLENECKILDLCELIRRFLINTNLWSYRRAHFLITKYNFIDFEWFTRIADIPINSILLFLSILRVRSGILDFTYTPIPPPQILSHPN